MHTLPRTVAVIGLGQMGKPMAANLVAKGFRTLGYDVAEGARSAAATIGVEIGSSAGEVFSRAEVALLSMPTEQVLVEVVAGENGLLREGAAGKLLIDTTTTTVKTAQVVAEKAAAAGAAFLDAPVTGGAAGAEKGTLTFMVGGEAGAYQRAVPVLSALGTNLVHVGPSGHGQVAKMVNQMLMAAIYTSVAEAFAFAAQFGTDVSKVYQAVENGGGASRLLGSIKPRLLGGLLANNHNITQHGKDIDYVMEEATRRKLFLPITSSVHEFYNLSRSLGMGHLWSGEMWAVWEKLLGIDHTATLRSEPQP